MDEVMMKLALSETIAASKNVKTATCAYRTRGI